MFYRYNALTRCLQASGQLQAVVPQGLRPSAVSKLPIKYKYEPLLGADASPAPPVRQASSGVPGQRRYKSWKDVPDELIPKTSRRDPDNILYSKPHYIKFRKMQIYCQSIQDEVPVWRIFGTRDLVLFYFTVLLTIIPLGWWYYEYYQTYLKPVKK